MPEYPSRCKCVKTGCALVIRGDYEGFMWGDLHAIGTTFIFNATVKRGEPIQTALELNDEAVTITLPPGASYFERRGVFVFHQADAVPSKALNEHFREWEPQYHVEFRRYG